MITYKDLSVGQKARLTRLFSQAAEAGDTYAVQLRQLADGDRKEYAAAINKLMTDGRVGINTEGSIFFDNRIAEPVTEEEATTEEPVAAETVVAEPVATEPAVMPFASTASEPATAVLNAIDRTIAIRVGVEMTALTVAVETSLLAFAERTLAAIESEAVEKARQAFSQREPFRSLSLHLLACQQVQYEAVLASLGIPNVPEVSASVFGQIVEEAKQRASSQR